MTVENNDGLTLPQGSNVEVVRDIVDTFDGLVPDPDWETLDSLGHHHFMSPNKTNPYPTLTTEITDLVWDHERGVLDVIRSYVCRACGQIIHPGKKPGTTYVHGPTRGRIKARVELRFAHLYEQAMINYSPLTFTNVPGTWHVVCISTDPTTKLSEVILNLASLPLDRGLTDPDHSG